MYDIIIIGAGGAGLTAAIYTTRYDFKTLVLTKDIGGQAAITDTIENYPGFEKISGFEIMQKFSAQAKKHGAEIKFEEALSFFKDSSDDLFKIKTQSAEYQAKAVILALGLKHRELGVLGEAKFKARGVSYCATCDGPLYRDKTVVVVGSGNSALEGCELLGRIGQKVYSVVRGDKYKGEPGVVKKVMANSKIEKIFHSEILEIKGQEGIESVMIKNRQTGKEQELENIDGVFVTIGYQASTKWLGDLVERNSREEIKVSRSNKTKTPGLFAAGDVTEVNYKQLVVSAGEGCKAALSAVEYLKER